MEGPTPVSALIHAATMVTAGVYMVARCSALFVLSPDAMLLVAVVGAFTAIFAASIGLVQNDIKRVLAYSTVSQLGYMFLACGVGAFGAGVFHLMTHAFFKALLFLGRGKRDSRLERGAGHAPDGRPQKTHPGHVLDHDGGNGGHCGLPAPGGLFQQGRNSVARLLQFTGALGCCGRWERWRRE